MMPTFAVHITLVGPLRDMSDGKRFDRAYSHRYVRASDPETAVERAIEKLQAEPGFARLRHESGIGPPHIEIDEVRRASWRQGLFSGAALVFCLDTPDRNA